MLHQKLFDPIVKCFGVICDGYEPEFYLSTYLQIGGAIFTVPWDQINNNYPFV